jgi:hypothetical protein
MDQHELELFQSNPPLKTENLHCYNDPDYRLTIVAYSGELTPAVTSQAYAWLGRAKPELLKLIRGSIFDFRKVTIFNTGNLSTLQRKSRELNAEIKEYQIPVAMLVANLYQEKMVYISSKISPGEDRKRIVKSVDAALAFLEEYNKKWDKHIDTNASSALLIES